jgi:O-antigen ligase
MFVIKMKLLLVARSILALEPLILALMTFAFWFGSPVPLPARDQWLWTLVLIPILWGARWLCYGHLWTRTPLDGWLLLFIILAVVNIAAAPFRRAPNDAFYSFIILMCRPLLGMAFFFYCVEFARQHNGPEGLMFAVAVFGLLLGLLALGTSQWNSKSDILSFITHALPRLKGFPGAEGGFNANEMAGALAWVCPLLASIALYPWRRRLFSALAALAFALVFVALFLGQSRFALFGALAALAGVFWLTLPRGRTLYAALAGVAVFTVLELLLLFNVLRPPTTQTVGLNARDEDSMEGRFDVWKSALDIIRDHPLTGVGLNMFRDGRVRALYPAPRYEQSVLPHAHNEWLQIGSDMGVPGLLVYIGWYVVIGWMLYRVYRRGDRGVKALAAGVAGGLFAHGIFGLGDAITLWDRFFFIPWLLFGLAGAAYILTERKTESAQVL